MAKNKEIRAQFDRETITVYQAYSPTIGLVAAKNNRFVEPFSYNRMTWIKPSFLWMMERSNWGLKTGQEVILAIKVKRECFEKALLEAVLTSPSGSVYKSSDEWRELMKRARIHVQWDPERNIHGGKLEYRSLQIGISRHLIQAYNEEWITGIDDVTPLVKKIHALKREGQLAKAKSFLPKESVYPVAEELMARLGMD